MSHYKRCHKGTGEFSKKYQFFRSISKMYEHIFGILTALAVPFCLIINNALGVIFIMDYVHEFLMRPSLKWKMKGPVLSLNS